MHIVSRGVISHWAQSRRVLLAPPYGRPALARPSPLECSGRSSDRTLTKLIIRAAPSSAVDARAVAHGGRDGGGDIGGAGGGTGEDDDRCHNGEFRSQALQLYRDTLRMCRGFPLSDPSDGVPWRLKLARSARAEFDAHRGEADKFEASRWLACSRLNRPRCTPLSSTLSRRFLW